MNQTPPFTESTSPNRLWQLRTRRLEAQKRPLLMGIVNVTPDSFSDGGKFLDRSAAVEHARRLVEEGADIIDVGGESTRPYAQPVEESEELARVLPVIEELVRTVSVPISVDTRKPMVARAALEVGVEILNDVEGLRRPEMREIAAEFLPGVCVMHMRETPETMQDDPTYEDVVAEVCSYLARRRDELVAMGISADRVCLDPGIGFGKKTEHNVALLRGVDQLLALGAPVLIGHSRKGFLGKLMGNMEADRTAATVGVAVAMAMAGVTVLRVHDVLAVRHAVECALAVAPGSAFDR